MTELEYLRVLSEAAVDEPDEIERFFEIMDSSTVDAQKLVIKGSTMLAKEFREAAKEPDPKLKLRRVKRIRKHAVALRSKANEIPADTATDHIWRMLTNTWWMSAIDYGIAIARPDRHVSEMSKDDAIAQINAIIKAIDLEIARLERKIQEEESNVK